jgi:hypothetical protein
LLNDLFCSSFLNAPGLPFCVELYTVLEVGSVAVVLCLLCPVVFRFVFLLLVFFGGRLDLAINWLLFLILFWALLAPSASFLYALF